MIDQLNIYGKNKVEVAIERIKMFEPPEGYYLAFSGGKDSVVIKALADMAKVRYDAHYNLTTVDPPELVAFVRTFKDVIVESPKETMWKLIVKNGVPPTRLMRYCCKELKENGGDGRFTITGVRHAESSRRKNNRSGLEADNGEKHRELLDPDNPSNEEIVRICPVKGKHILNPIIDWEDDDVWEFIKKYNVSYCKLYDQGYKRLGCIGCPMSSLRKKEFERYPKFKEAYIRAFERMIVVRKTRGLKCKWKTGEDVFNWWINN